MNVKVRVKQKQIRWVTTALHIAPKTIPNATMDIQQKNGTRKNAIKLYATAHHAIPKKTSTNTNSLSNIQPTVQNT
jgi:hypothetical protein